MMAGRETHTRSPLKAGNRSHHIYGTHAALASWADRHGAAFLLIVIFSVCAVVQFYTVLNPDLVWLLQMTSEMLDGMRLYVNRFDPAPPLIFWIYAGPVAVAKAFSLPLVVVLKFFVIVLVALVLTLCRAILYSFPPERTCKRSFLLGLAALFLLAPNMYVTFAQREHLLVVFFLPYALLYLPSVDRQRLTRPKRGLIGLMAGIGLCIKPHFFVLWLFVLAWNVFRARSLRPLFGIAEWMIAMTALSYVAAVWLFVPQYFTWLDTLVPYYVLYGYAGESDLDTILWFAGRAGLALAMAWACGLFSIPADRSYRRDVFFMGLIAVAAWTQALLQFKTWPYMDYPLLVFGTIAVLIAVAFEPQRKVIMRTAMLAWVFYFMTPWAEKAQITDHGRYEGFIRALGPLSRMPDMYLIGIYTTPSGFVKEKAPLYWANRFNSYNYLLMGIMKVSPVSKFPTIEVKPGYEKMEQWVVDTLAEDLKKTKPRLLVADMFLQTMHPKEEYFDTWRWMNRHPALVEIMRDYKFDREIKTCAAEFSRKRNSCQVYTVFVRQEARE